MKSFIVLALLVAAAVAVPVEPKDDETVAYEQTPQIGDGTFSYGYKTGLGISAQQEGILKNVGTENEASEVRGQFSYPGPDGVTYTVTYVANELGFQPSGAHIPVDH